MTQDEKFKQALNSRARMTPDCYKLAQVTVSKRQVKHDNGQLTGKLLSPQNKSKTNVQTVVTYGKSVGRDLAKVTATPKPAPAPVAPAPKAPVKPPKQTKKKAKPKPNRNTYSPTLTRSEALRNINRSLQSVPLIGRVKPAPAISPAQQAEIAKRYQESQLQLELQRQLERDYHPEVKPQETGRKFRIVNGMVEFY